MVKASPIQFSVCIPVHEGRVLFPATLASLRAQTHTDWELVVVEDGSREPVRDLVEAFGAETDHRVTYHANATNLGVYRTRDIAIGHARHEWIAWLDADDLWQPDHLAALAATIEQDQKLEFVFSGYRTFAHALDDSNHVFAPTPEHMKNVRAALFFCKLLLQPSCLAIRRSLLERTGPWALGVDRLPGFLKQRNFGEDRNFLLRSLKAGAHLAWTGKVTSGYRRHPGSMTVQHGVGLIYRAAYYDLNGRLADLPKGDQSRFIAHAQANAAKDSLKMGRPGREVAWFFWRAWRWHPLRGDRLLRAATYFFKAGR